MKRKKRTDRLAKNVGKLFEDDFKNSIPVEWVLLHRLKDSATSFSGGNALRFSIKNPCDFFEFDSERGIFYTLELKSVGGKSISFEREKGQHGEIHYHQIKGLTEFGEYKRVVSGFIINFRCEDKTYFVPINTFNEMMDEIDKKSFNITDIENHTHIEITGEKKRTRYRYDIESFMDEATKLIGVENV